MNSKQTGLFFLAVDGMRVVYECRRQRQSPLWLTEEMKLGSGQSATLPILSAFGGIGLALTTTDGGFARVRVARMERKSDGFQTELLQALIAGGCLIENFSFLRLEVDSVSPQVARLRVLLLTEKIPGQTYRNGICSDMRLLAGDVRRTNQVHSFRMPMYGSISPVITSPPNLGPSVDSHREGILEYHESYRRLE